MTSSMNGWTKDLSTAGLSVPYAMSKSAIGHFTSSLAHDLLPLGIRVNGIAPGLFITEMTAPGTIDSAGISHLESKETGLIPLDKMPLFEIPCRQARNTGVPLLGGTNRDMGSLALFLTANWYVNGETVLIDGGVSFPLLHQLNFRPNLFSDSFETPIVVLKKFGNDMTINSVQKSGAWG